MEVKKRRGFFEAKPTSLDQVIDHRTYTPSAVMSLFGAPRSQVMRWAYAGLLERLPDTGARWRFSGTEIKRFARDVYGVQRDQEAAA